MIRRCKIKDIGYFFGGLTGKNKDDFNIGNAKYVSYMTVFSNSRLPDSITDIVSISKNEKQNKIQKGDVLFTGSSETPDECGMSCVVTKDVVGDVYLNSFCFGLRFHNNEILNSSYLAHYFRSNYARKQISKTANGVTRFNISKKLFSEIEIVYPSIKVQEEIVEILDSFTNLIDALNEELSLRQKQFEYYREKLLTFKECECEWKKLGDILDYEQPSKYIVSSSEYDDNYEIPVLTAGQTFILGYTDEKDGIYKASKKNPTIIFDDFTTGHHWVDFDFKIKSSAMKMLRLKNNKSLLRYIFHSMALINYVPTEHSRQWISKYSQYEIPLPHIKVQEEIVNLLDTFTNLISSLKEEIALRQKQYEYYREKLLTFN